MDLRRRLLLTSFNRLNAPKQALAECFAKLASGDSDSLDVNKTMNYIEQLGLKLDDIGVLVLFETVGSPSFGKIMRDKFIDGWLQAGSSKYSGQQTPATLSSQAAYIDNVVKALPTDEAVLRRVYGHTFTVAREPNQRALPLEDAKSYWDVLLGPAGYPWKGSATGVDWLAKWKQFLDEKWTKTISKDMWSQTLEFVFKSRADEKLEFWDENGSWPTAIDEFVCWVREQKTGLS